MNSSIRHPRLVRSAFVALLAMTGTSFAQDPQSLDKRLTLIERKLDSAALGEMANQMEALRQQVQDLQGQIEHMQRQFHEVKERQRNIYSDIDSRLRELEQGTTGLANDQNPPSAGPASPKTDQQTPDGKRAPAGGGTNRSGSQDGGALQEKNKTSDDGKAQAQQGDPLDPTEEQAAYERAFNTLRDGQYARSQQEFHEFLRRYPNSQYADNARYWLGESYYVERHFDQAMEHFQKVLNNFPHSSKRPGAQLKIGFIQYEQGKLDRARKTLGQVIQRYPNSTAASLAQQRLRLIDNSQR